MNINNLNDLANVFDEVIRADEKRVNFMEQIANNLDDMEYSIESQAHVLNDLYDILEITNIESDWTYNRLYKENLV